MDNLRPILQKCAFDEVHILQNGHYDVFIFVRNAFVANFTFWAMWLILRNTLFAKFTFWAECLYCEIYVLSRVRNAHSASDPFRLTSHTVSGVFLRSSWFTILVPSQETKVFHLLFQGSIWAEWYARRRRSRRVPSRRDYTGLPSLLIGEFFYSY